MTQNRAMESFERLVAGNQRFTQGLRSIHTYVDGEKMRQLAENGQKPFAIILTCSDSRLPAELLFDQGFGDLFVIRVAGNVVAPSLLASMEFAVLNFGTPLILVMGHTKCGAVNAARDYVANPTMALTENLRELVSRIEPSIHKAKMLHKHEPGKELIDLCTWENVNHSMRAVIEQSLTIRNFVESGKVLVRGAVCDLTTGKVTFANAHESKTENFFPSVNLESLKSNPSGSKEIRQ